MVIWSTLETSCPICENRVRLREVGSGFATGQDSDLLVRMEGKHIIQAEVHTCLHCHFSGFGADFLRTISPAARRRFREEVSPLLVDDATALGAPPVERQGQKARAGSSRPEYTRTPLPDIQYYWSYRTAEALALPPVSQGLRLVRAYWCLRLDPTARLPAPRLKALRKLYLRGAIQKLRQGVRFEPDPNLIYLIGELCRRNENYLLAIGYFRRFLERDGGAMYLKLAAKRLIEEARNRVPDPLSMEEVLYDRAPGNKSRPAKPPQGKGDAPGRPAANPRSSAGGEGTPGEDDLPLDE
jgi:hypothetical protein